MSRKYSEKYQDDSGNQEPEKKGLTAIEKQKRWGCSSPGCPLFGAISYGHGEGASYVCRFHLRASPQDAPYITTRLRNLMHENRWNNQELYWALDRDPGLSYWVRHNQMRPAEQPTIKQRQREQRQQEPQPQQQEVENESA